MGKEKKTIAEYLAGLLFRGALRLLGGTDLYPYGVVLLYLDASGKALVSGDSHRKQTRVEPILYQRQGRLRNL